MSGNTKAMLYMRQFDERDEYLAATDGTIYKFSEVSNEFEILEQVTIKENNYVLIERYYVPVARLVAKAFNVKFHHALDVDHEDVNYLNNNIVNLIMTPASYETRKRFKAHRNGFYGARIDVPGDRIISPSFETEEELAEWYYDTFKLLYDIAPWKKKNE